MNDKFKEYIRENWDGWPLHSVIAAVSMMPWFSNLLNIYAGAMLGANIFFWPLREMWQHDDKLGVRIGFWKIWTLHRMIEWGAPIVVALVMYLFVV